MMVLATVTVQAADSGKGKYVKDVFIAYGEKKEDAEEWLRNHGWEPVCDLNAGKSSSAAGIHNAVAVLGIRRTSDPNEAITDMATMFMKGGYSFDDYESLVKEKKADIEEFINTFVPALEEYRDNYAGRGSEGGKKRAQMAHDILNKFFDGDPNDKYAVNDTGKPLGDLLLNKTKTEIGEDAYNALSAEQKKNTADLEQIILESSGPAIRIIEQTLALATDTANDSWLQRLDGLSGTELVKRIAEFVPEAEGQNLAPSAAMTLLASHFEDYSKLLAAEWLDVHEDIVWFEEYCDEHDLWPEENEIYSSKIEPYFASLAEEDEGRYYEESGRFQIVNTYYYVLKGIDYSGEWGDTLYDFLRPEDEYADYSKEYNFFAPLAAVLSKGQRAALTFISFSTLLKLGLDSDCVVMADFPSVEEFFKNAKNEEMQSISIYSGINRAIFRRGVALTSATRMQKAMGNDPYEDLWDEGGIIDILAYSTFASGVIAMAAGIGMMIRGAQVTAEVTSAAAAAAEAAAAQALAEIPKLTTSFQNKLKALNYVIDSVTKAHAEASNAFRVQNAMELVEKASMKLDKAKAAASNTSYTVGEVSKLTTAGRWLAGIGGALMLAAIALKAVQLYQFYHRTFTQIPTMIVDEADIVTYTTNSEGKKVKNITFDQFVYYEAVPCNRQQIGIHTNAQGGVSDYAEWGCGDAADINADVGKQWLAIYFIRSPKKGNPILADSLLLRTGAEEVKKGNKASEAAKMPSGYNGCLHMFASESPVKIDNVKFCYRSDNEGMYLYWRGDKGAFTASSFGTGGTIAISSVGGLIVGILGATAVLLPKKKKEQGYEPAQA